jgi:hypothetical protein
MNMRIAKPTDVTATPSRNDEIDVELSSDITATGCGAVATAGTTGATVVGVVSTAIATCVTGVGASDVVAVSDVLALVVVDSITGEAAEVQVLVAAMVGWSCKATSESRRARSPKSSELVVRLWRILRFAGVPGLLMGAVRSPDCIHR